MFYVAGYLLRCKLRIYLGSTNQHTHLMPGPRRFKETYRVDTTRMKQFDYSSPGKYFVTICAYGREPCFGDVVGDTVRLAELGMVANQSWNSIPTHFSNVGI